MADILVVEDDFYVRMNLVLLLQKSGYNAVSAESAEEALEIMRKMVPDVIISNIKMSGMDGYEFFDKTNGEDKDGHIPFIFLTGKTEITDMRRGLLAGADDYITKPFRARELLESIETRLKKKEKHDKIIERFKNNITRNLNHEFRTPLVPIIGYSQIIKEHYWQLSPEEVLEMAEKIHDAGSWMLKIMEKFLLLAELESNSRRKGGNFASIKETVNKCSLKVTSHSGRYNDLFINIEEAIVNMSESELEILIIELLENAVKFSNAGTTIIISSEFNEGRYLLMVSDLGRGMAPEQVSSLSSFMQFRREGMHRASLGLGLAIVKKIAERNGIEITIESDLGLYTKVGLLFPLQ